MSSGELEAVELDLLRHLGRYRLSFREVMDALFAEGKSSRRPLEKLERLDLLRKEKGFGGNRTAWTLTRKGAEAAGLNHSRSTPMGTAAMATYLALFSFCCLKGRPRLLLTKEELRELFPDGVPPGRHHCLEASTRRRQVCQAYVPGPSLGALQVVEHVRDKYLPEIRKASCLREWLAARLYGVAVIVETPERKKAIEAALATADDGDGAPLLDALPIWVESAPTPGVPKFEEALHALVET